MRKNKMYFIYGSEEIRVSQHKSTGLSSTEIQRITKLKKHSTINNKWEPCDHVMCGFATTV